MRAALLALLGCALAVLTVLSVLPTCVHSGGSARAGGMATMTVVQDMTSHVPSHPCGDDKPACHGARGTECAVVSGRVPDALQPDAVPQAIPATLPVLMSPRMAVAHSCRAAPRYTARPLDLHLLQVQRT